MTYLLDTNTCIEQLRGRANSALTARLTGAAPGDVVLCSVVIAELVYGAARSTKRTENLAKVRRFCAGFRSLPFDDSAADEYGVIRAHLESIGMLIGPNDLMIASIARAQQLTLVSHNSSEFSRVPGLNLEDWQLP